MKFGLHSTRDPKKFTQLFGVPFSRSGDNVKVMGVRGLKKRRWFAFLLIFFIVKAAFYSDVFFQCSLNKKGVV